MTLVPLQPRADGEVRFRIHDLFVVPGSVVRCGDWKLLVNQQNPWGNGAKGEQGRLPTEAGSMFILKDDLGETINLEAQHP